MLRALHGDAVDLMESIAALLAVIFIALAALIPGSQGRQTCGPHRIGRWGGCTHLPLRVPTDRAFALVVVTPRLRAGN